MEIGREVGVVIVMKPKSLRMRVPAGWSVEKLKLLLVSTLPTLAYDSFDISHRGQPLPHTLALSAIANPGEQLTLQLTATPKSASSPSITPLLELRSLLSASPFQPSLHPKYYALQQRLKVEELTHQPTHQRLREAILNLQNMQQVRNMLLHREQQPVDWLQRFVLLLEAFFVGFILYSVYGYMESKHYVATLVFFLLFAVIQFENRRQPTRIAMAVGKAAKRKEEKEAVEVRKKQTAIKAEVRREAKWKINGKIWATEKVSWSCEVCLGFALSIFPNWRLQTHLGSLQYVCNEIEEKLKEWRSQLDAGQADGSQALLVRDGGSE